MSMAIGAPDMSYMHNVFWLTLSSMLPMCTVRVKKTCPNLREEYSSCGPYKFTCKHCVRPRTLIERFLHSPLCTKNESLVHGTAIVEAWVY